jgi:adenosylcobyric acid synthase
MGRTVTDSPARPFLEVIDRNELKTQDDGISIHAGRVFGTYLHGLFDQSLFRRWWLNRLRTAKGWEHLAATPGLSLDERIDHLADFVEQHLSMPMVDRLLDEGV